MYERSWQIGEHFQRFMAENGLTNSTIHTSLRMMPNRRTRVQANTRDRLQ
jgi:hypothetical protein